MPTVIVEWSLQPVAYNTDSTADVKDVAKSSIEKFDGDEVGPARVVVVVVDDVSMTAVQNQPCRLRRSQLPQPQHRLAIEHSDQLLTYDVGL